MQDDIPKKLHAYRKRLSKDILLSGTTKHIKNKLLLTEQATEAIKEAAESDWETMPPKDRLLYRLLAEQL